MNLFSKLITPFKHCRVHVRHNRKFSIVNPMTEKLLYENTSRIIPPPLVMIFGVSQFLFWNFMAYLIMKDLKKGRVGIFTLHFARPQGFPEEVLERTKPSSALKLRIIFSLISLTLGVLILNVAYIYSTRLVRRIYLLDNCSVVRVISSTAFGRTKEIIRPIDRIKSKYSLQRFPQNRLFLPLKLEKIRFHFLVDKKGHFSSKRFFDTCFYNPTHV